MTNINARETHWLFVMLILSRITLDAVSVFVKNSGTAAVINSAFGFLIAFALLFVTDRCFKRSSFDDVARDVYGKFGQRIFGFVFFCITLLNSVRRITMFSDAIGDFVLTASPYAFILIIFAVCAFVTALLGIEALVRISYITGGVTVLLIGIIMASSLVEVDITNIYPVLGKGRISNVFDMLYVYSDIVYLYYIKNSISGGQKHTFVKPLVKSAVVVSLVTLFYTLCVPYPVSEKFSYPIYRLASLSNTTVLIQRLDGIVFLIWIFSGFVSVGSLVYFASQIFKDTFCLKDRKGTLPIIAFLVFIIALIGGGKWNCADGIISAFAFGALPATAIIFKYKNRRKKCKKSL